MRATPRYCLIYTRFSPRPDEATSDSCEKQAAACCRFAAVRGLEVRAVYEDRCLSGKDVNRPGLWACLGDLRRGEALLVVTLDRLARNTFLALDIEKEVTRKGASIVSISGEGTWEDTDEGKLVRRIMQALAEYNRAKIAARTKAGMARRRVAGLVNGSEPPIGYRIERFDDTKRLVPEPDEQRAIRTVLSLHLQGKSLRAICARMEELTVSIRGGFAGIQKP